MGGSTFFSTSNTLVQEIVPDELRGRVMAIYMLDQGVAPLGSLFAGAMASMAGAPLAQQVMGCLLFSMAFLVLVRIPQIRRLE
jgi:MFS family permease